jgi:hypothetical protein
MQEDAFWRVKFASKTFHPRQRVKLIDQCQEAKLEVPALPALRSSTFSCIISHVRGLNPGKADRKTLQHYYLQFRVRVQSSEYEYRVQSTSTEFRIQIQSIEYRV